MPSCSRTGELAPSAATSRSRFRFDDHPLQSGRTQQFDAAQLRQFRQQRRADPARLGHVAECIHAFLAAVEVGNTGTAAFGDVNLADRGSGRCQRIPQAQGLEDAPGPLGQGEGAVVVAGMLADRQRRGFNQADPQIPTTQGAGQAGADQAPADDENVVVGLRHGQWSVVRKDCFVFPLSASVPQCLSASSVPRLHRFPWARRRSAPRCFRW